MDVREILGRSPSYAEPLRLFAQNLLQQANDRGDQDWETVSWAVNEALRLSTDAAAYGNRATTPSAAAAETASRTRIRVGPHGQDLD